MTQPSFVANCTRSGKWWAISVPDADGLWTQARRLDQAEAMAREAIAAVLDLDENAIDVELHVNIGDPALDQAVETARRLRAQLEQLQQDSADQMDATVELLRSRANLPMRDVAKLLGISHQRVGQIARR